VVQVVGAARYRRAQVAGGNVPEQHAVVVHQQRAVQRFDGGRVVEIHGFDAVLVMAHKLGQLGVGRNQRGKIVALAVQAAKVQAGFAVAGREGNGHGRYRKINRRIVRALHGQGEEYATPRIQYGRCPP